MPHLNHSLMLVLCVECKLHMFELVKFFIMQLFLDYWFKGDIYSSKIDKVSHHQKGGDY